MAQPEIWWYVAIIGSAPRSRPEFEIEREFHMTLETSGVDLSNSEKFYGHS